MAATENLWGLEKKYHRTGERGLRSNLFPLAFPAAPRVSLLCWDTLDGVLALFLVPLERIKSR